MSATPVPINPKVQPYKSIEIIRNGNYEVVPDTPYNGIAKVGVSVDVPSSSTTVLYGSAVTMSSNEETFTPDPNVGDGFSALTVNAENRYWAGYSWGAEQARTIDEQTIRNNAVGLEITQNGHYDARISTENPFVGWISAVTVNVTGQTIINQNKSITAETNGNITITFDSGYTGLGTVDININVPKGWGPYEDNEFWYVRELCVISNGVESYYFNGDYLCHCNNDNTYAGVTIQDGHITATGYMTNPVKLGDDHYICIQNYTNPNTHTVEHYSFECWIEQAKVGYDKYLNWKCSSIISMFDAYDTGRDKEGLI